MRKLFLVITLTFSNGIFGTSWVGVPLEKLIEDSEVVVVGKITEVTKSVLWPWAERNEGMLNDLAIIEVSAVLKNEFEWKGSDEEDFSELKIPITMYSSRYGGSFDHRFDVGDEGIWILEWHADRFYVGYPKRLQSLEKIEEIKAIIQNQKSE